MEEEKNMDDRAVLCQKCLKHVPISEIKSIPKGDGRKMNLCKDCMDKAKIMEKRETRVSNKAPYFCLRCRYKFKFDPRSQAQLKCPYCGRSDQITEDNVGLVREVDDYDFVFH
jgi:protein-arginine kinase activator protein McsA